MLGCQNLRDDKFFSSLINARSDFQVEIQEYVCISEFQKILCVLFSKTDSGLYIHH